MSLMEKAFSILAVANMSFGCQGHSRSGGPDNSLPIHHIFPPYNHMHDFVTRAAAFGLLTKDTEVILDIPVSAITAHEAYPAPRLFDCAILEIATKDGAGLAPAEEKFLHIYKDKTTGFYYIGQLKEDVLHVDAECQNGLRENEVYFKTFEWCRDYATMDRSKRIPLHNAMLAKNIPGESLPLRVGKAFRTEFMGYLSKTLG